MFYQYLDQVMIPGVDLNLTVSKTETGLIVLVMPKVNDLKDPARNKLTPLVLKGAPKELDANFFPAISAPIRKTSGLLLNMKSYERQTDQAAAASKAEKDKKEKEGKEAKEKKDKYDGFIKKADEFEAAGKPEEALTQLKQARLHATEKQAKAVDEKIAALRAKQGQASLFDPFVAVPSAPPAPAARQHTAMPANPVQPAQIQPDTQDSGLFSPRIPHSPQPYTPPAELQPRFEIESQSACREDEYAEIEDFPTGMKPPMFSEGAYTGMNF